MDFQAWTIFALFWVVFVTTPGPNALNCLSNGMYLGFWRALPGVAGILTQASLFLGLSAIGIATLLAGHPQAFGVAKWLGAGVLIWLGMRGWIAAKRPAVLLHQGAGSVYRRAFLIATINPKSVAGYLAAFTQFVQPDVPVWGQMWVIAPTALSITAASYLCFTALGAGLGQLALGAVTQVWVRRAMAACFIIYGVLLGSMAVPRGA